MPIKFRNKTLNDRAASIRAFRKLEPHTKVAVQCAGGCGHSHLVRAGKIKEGHLFICDRITHREQDLRQLPLVLDCGRVRVVIPQQAGGFSGVRYVHKGFKATAKAVVHSWFRAAKWSIKDGVARIARS